MSIFNFFSCVIILTLYNIIKSILIYTCSFGVFGPYVFPIVYIRSQCDGKQSTLSRTEEFELNG